MECNRLWSMWYPWLTCRGPWEYGHGKSCLTITSRFGYEHALLIDYLKIELIDFLAIRLVKVTQLINWQNKIVDNLFKKHLIYLKVYLIVLLWLYKLQPNPRIAFCVSGHWQLSTVSQHANKPYTGRGWLIQARESSRFFWNSGLFTSKYVVSEFSVNLN